MKETDITGRRFGRLTALYRDGLSRSWQAIWVCRCDCGKEVRVCKNNLLSGRSRSCGCLKRDLLRERNLKRHGKDQAPLGHDATED